MGLNTAQIGELQISKGTHGDLQINLWDAVRKCRGTNCKFAHMCPYEFAQRNEGDVNHLACRVERKYLTQNLEPFMQLLDVVPDKFMMQFIGMHIIPLYVDLCHLKMEKFLVTEVTYEDGKGQIRTHPIFDEIRKGHREIMSVWKTLGIMDIAKKAGYFQVRGLMTPSDDFDFTSDGDGEAYDEMAKAD